MSDPLVSTADGVRKDQHKLPLPAFAGALAYLVDAVFTEARERGVRVRFKYTHPGTILNDGTGTPYVDLAEKSNNQGSFEGEWSMDPREPVNWPAQPSP